MAPGISGLVVVLRCQRAQIQRQIDLEDLELHEVEEALVTTQSVSADTKSIVRAVRRLDLNDEGADDRFRIGAHALRRNEGFFYFMQLQIF